MTIDDRVALVTGGSGALGSVHCLTLAKAGCQVALTGYAHMDRAEALAKEIQAMGRSAIAIKMDVSNLDEVQRGVKRIEEVLGPVDILVNNAGGALFTPVEMDRLEEEHWDLVVDTNLKGAFLCAKEVLPHMKAQRYGRIVNVSSKAGRTYGTIAGAHYVSAKASVVGLTRQLAWEYGRYGITVNAVAPGLFLSTERIKNLWASRPQEIKDQLIREIALGRLGEVDELAKVVLFLASDDASYVTGVILDVNGGRFMG